MKLRVLLVETYGIHETKSACSRNNNIVKKLLNILKVSLNLALLISFHFVHFPFLIYVDGERNSCLDIFEYLTFSLTQVLSR